MDPGRGRDAPERRPPERRRNPATLLAYRLVCAALLLLGLWVCWYASGLQYYTPLGPGPGFFPLWIGLLLTAFSAALLTASFLRIGPPAVPPFAPQPGPLLQMATTFAMVALFALAVERLGFTPTMFVILLVLLLSRGCRPFPTALAVALGGSFGVGYAFTHWLDVYVPPAPFGLLGAIGL